MEYLSLIATVAFVHLLAVMSPGPDFIVAVKNSLTYSRRAGIWTAVGFGLGICVHIFYCLAGLALVISNSILIFNTIKLLGAGYLIYIGIASLRARSLPVKIEHVDKQKDMTVWQAIKSGFLTNALNPKATLFFLSLFTFVISPTTPGVIMAIISLIMVIDTMVWFSLVAIFFTQQKIIGVVNRFQGLFNKVVGGFLVLLGIKVIFTER